jgi:hypothetical protein
LNAAVAKISLTQEAVAGEPRRAAGGAASACRSFEARSQAAALQYQGLAPNHSREIRLRKANPDAAIGSAIEPADIGHVGALLDRRKTAGSPSIVLPLRALRAISRQKIKILEETDAKAAERG